MITAKQKVGYLESRLKEFIKTQEKSMSFQNKIMMQSTISALSSLLKTTKEEMLQKSIDFITEYMNTLSEDYETVDHLEEALETVK